VSAVEIPILISGGGIGGMAAGLALAQSGFSALRDRLFARRAADDYTGFDWLYGSRG
jgi:2-polyprenyl-6-methoxyphenol hydroxylase-like FAD-dependent oxidoreductase